MQMQLLYRQYDVVWAWVREEQEGLCARFFKSAYISPSHMCSTPMPCLAITTSSYVCLVYS